MPDAYFVKFDDAKRARVSALIAMKELLEGTKHQLKLREFAQQKKVLKERFAKELQSLVQTVVIIQKALPHEELLQEQITARAKQPTPTPSVSQLAKKPETKPKRNISELDSLNDALARIEQKLADLE